MDADKQRPPQGCADGAQDMNGSFIWPFGSTSTLNASPVIHSDHREKKSE